VCGDAYNVRDALAEVVKEPCAGFVSSLPLLTKPLEQRLDLIGSALDMLQPGAPFIQFTYAVVPPVPPQPGRYTAIPSERIWLNLPPARVWVYRRP
jgi:phosphatidylethanolamine/phosphatidyl-N-methylethanolamine N-methyltransferase